MDALPPPSPSLPPPAPPAAVFVAPSETGPRTEEERKICERGSQPDWIYLGGLVALDVGAIALNPSLKYNESQLVRTLGPAFIGLSFGATLGGGAMALPSCDPRWAPTAPPEGDVRPRWPLALAIAGVSAGIGPIVAGIVTGGLDRNWTYTERSSRMWVAAGAGFIGALLPYVPLLSPKPLRAARELERLRVDPMLGGVSASYTVRF